MDIESNQLDMKLEDFLGIEIYRFIGVPNIPFAAALATIPMLIMAVYLIVARRLGAFEAL